MATSPHYFSTLRLLVCVCFCLVLSPAARSQQPPVARPYIPSELQASDQEVRELLAAAESKSEAGEYETAFADSKAALELAEKKGLLGDRAIAEESVATGYFASGKLDESLKLYQASLQHAIDSSNLVLQADALVALSTLPQLRGNLPGALELLAKAQERANQSKNLFIKARVLGELGKLQVFSGQIEQGRQSIDEALSIDRANGYDYEPLHSVYAAYVVLSQQAPDLAKAIAQLESARDLAVQKENYVALVLAENTLGALYVRNGEPEKGIATLEAARNGNILKDGQAIQMPGSFRVAATLPFMKATLLEALAQGYESAQEPDEALQTWNELYSLSMGVGFNTEAEAAAKIGALYQSKKDTLDALEFFSKSVEAWRSLGNEEQLSQALIAESQLLIQTGKGEEAVPLEEEILKLAEKNHNRQRQFFTNMVLAEIYQPADKFQEARSVLETAQALIRPGPADSEIDGKLVLETYGRLADVYKALQLPIKELISLEKAIAVLQNLKDDPSLQQTIAYTRQRIESLHVEDLATKAANDTRLAESLWYSEILYLWNGAPDPTKDENWNRVINLPGRVIQLPDGPEAMEEIQHEIGPLLGVAQLPILNALSNHFLTVEPKPNLAEQYAKQAELWEKQTPNPSDLLLVPPVCNLVLAYAQQREATLAKQQATDCQAVAERTHDPQSMNLANAAITTAQIAANDLTSALDSLRTFLAANPDDPELHAAVASGLAGGKLYKEAIAEFTQAIQIDERKGGPEASANVYVRMAAALATADSQEYRNVRLQSLKTAQSLYHKSGNTNAEALVTVDIGSFYSENADNKTALSYFHDAETLATSTRNLQLIAQASSSAGTAYHNLGDFHNAADFHRRAAAVSHEGSDKNSEATALVFACEDLFSQKQYDAASTVCLEAENIANSSNSPPIIRYWIQGNLGQIYYQQQKMEQAVTATQKAEQFAMEAGDQRQAATAYITLSGLYGLLGRSEDAASAAAKALAIFQSLNDAQGAVSAYAALVNIYGDRASTVRDFDKAMAYYAAGKQLGTPLQSQLDSDLVEIYVQTGRFSDAIKLADAGLQSCVRTHNTECQAGWLVSLAEAERKNGDLIASASSLDRAKRLAAHSKDLYLYGRLLYGQAGQKRAQGNLEQAFQYYKQLISLIERVKVQGDPNTRRSLSESYAFIYDEMASTLYAMSAGKSEAEKIRQASLALEYSETNKARQFSDSWGISFVAELRHTLPSDLQDKERTLLAKRDQLQSETEGQVPKAGLDSVEKELAKFVGDLRVTHPQYAAVAYPQPVALEGIPLRKGETLLEFKVTDDSTLVWVIGNVTGNKVQLVDFYQVSKPRQWFGERISKLRAALNNAQPEQIDWHNSEELFNELFPDSSSKTLLQSKRIVFIPDDILSVLPFELLSPEASKAHFPLLSIPTTYYPSAAALSDSLEQREVFQVGKNLSWGLVTQ